MLSPLMSRPLIDAVRSCRCSRRSARRSDLGPCCTSIPLPCDTSFIFARSHGLGSGIVHARDDVVVTASWLYFWRHQADDGHLRATRQCPSVRRGHAVKVRRGGKATCIEAEWHPTPHVSLTASIKGVTTCPRSRQRSETDLQKSMPQRLRLPFSLSTSSQSIGYMDLLRHLAGLVTRQNTVVAFDPRWSRSKYTSRQGGSNPQLDALALVRDHHNPKRERWAGLVSERRLQAAIGNRPVGPVTLRRTRWCRLHSTYCSLAYSARACLRIGMSASASFQSVRKSW